ncbi:MAG: exodeoxyribonuclease VII small subunit [Gammaproteobacteria bacterium]|nr:exodeoxyribonuclease VII small subunit [Gammaproteobacteria bacterium]
MTEARRPRLDLEKALAELEGIVAELESGDLPLEKALRQFERGVKLSRECQASLKDAEQRVQVLVESGLKDLDAPAPEASEPAEDDEQDDADA